jgi:selenocysteine lyase/cysteine desulfurase
MLTAQSRQQDFPGLRDRAYLNTAAEGIPPTCVLDALAQYGRDKLLGFDGRDLHEQQRQQARAGAAAMLGLQPDDIAICSCSSEAYNLVAMAMRLQPGDEVIINDLDFPAGATPWLAQSCPATVRVWKARAGGLRVEDLASLLTPRTRLLTVSLVSFFNGHVVNLAQIAKVLRQHSPALLAVDVTQALGRITMDLREADLIVSSTHKWILASHGGGLVGVPRHRADLWTVPAGGWFNLHNAFEPDRFDRVTHKRGADSFMCGMPNYAAIYAVNAALAYIQGVGVEAIDAHARPLVRACVEGLRRLPVQMLTLDEPDQLAGIVSFTHPDSEAIYRRLRQQDVHVMHSAGRMRVAIHGYNTADDVERLLRVLTDSMHG